MFSLECKDLTKRYGSRPALEQLNLALAPGRVVGLLGPNGSGKTTLIKLAMGLLQPSAGQILICGEKPSPKTNAVVSYLPERIALPMWMNARQVVDFYRDFYADFRTETAQKMLGQLGIGPKDAIRTMSKGTREKLQLCLVMSRQAKLYLLDEPIGGVDPATRDYILHTILSNYNPEATVLISTHLISDVETVLDEAIFLDHGQVRLHGMTDDLRETYGKSIDSLFREVFKCWEN